MNSKLFQDIDIFQGFNEPQLEKLRAIFLPVNDQADKVIFEQGDLAESIYLVLEGEVSIQFKPDDGPQIVITNVKEGGIIGWSAVVGSPVYTSSAICSVDTSMLRARGKDLETLCKQDPYTGNMVIERLAAVIAERLRNTHQHVISMLQKGLNVQVPVSAGAE